jgi:hypothetical protein
VHEGELVAALLRLREREAHDALDAERGVHRHLIGDLVGRADADAAAVAHVRTLCALAHHHEVDLARVAQRGLHAREHPRRPQVHVVIEGEP